MSNYLFSYGTLLPEHAPSEVAAAVAKLRPVAKGSVQGILYDFGDYPGAILDKSSNRKILGIVFRLPGDLDILHQLDEYEGFKPSARRKSHFIRKLHPVRLANGRTFRCWVYVYNRKPGAAPVVASGRYRKKRSQTGRGAKALLEYFTPPALLLPYSFMSDQEQPEVILPPPQSGESALEPSDATLVQKLGGGRGRKYVRFVVAALSSIPWVGGLFGAAAGFSAEKDQESTNELHRLWLEEHKEKVGQLGVTLGEIFTRLDGFGEEVQERIESEEYLALVRRTFRSWDEADTQEKRQMLKKLITNAGAITLCPDDLIRLFIAWIDQYHEAHFKVIKEIYRNQGITRGQIWDQIHGQRVREDSSDADLFRYLIRDLSTGGVVRQARETDMQGRFLKKDTRGQSRETSSRVMESAFDDTKPYVLTELGRQFVHYVMEDVVPQLGGSQPGQPK